MSAASPCVATLERESYDSFWNSRYIRAEHPGTRPGRHSSNCYGPPTKLKVMVGVVEMKVKVEGGITKINVNVMPVGGMRVR